jgi:hypothetical protein
VPFEAAKHAIVHVSEAAAAEERKKGNMSQYTQLTWSTDKPPKNKALIADCVPAADGNLEQPVYLQLN